MAQIASCKILCKTLPPVCDSFDISTCLLLSGISLVRLRFLPHYRDKRTEPIYRVPCQASPFTTLPLGSKVFLVSCMHFCWIQVDGCSEIVNIEFLLGSTFAGFNVLLSILLALLISAILSNISFIKLSSLLSRYPASSFWTSPC